MLIFETNEGRPEEVVLERDDPAPKKNIVFFPRQASATKSEPSQ